MKEICRNRNMRAFYFERFFAFDFYLVVLNKRLSKQLHL